MPPQCHQCGRFLSNDFVRGLPAAPASCPRCGSTLTAEQFQDMPAPQSPGVRPPDPPLEPVRPARPAPEAVLDAEDGDVLAGWDEGGRPQERSSSGEADLIAGGNGAGPTKATSSALAIVVGAGLAGSVVGALLTRRWRSVGATAGTGGGAGAPAGVRLLDEDRPHV